MNKDEAIKAIQEDLKQIAEKNKTVSMSVAVVRKDEVIWSYELGYSNLEKENPANSNTIYRVASISKSVAALVVMKLVEMGKVFLDIDISTYLGYNVRNPYYPDMPITLRHLMTHTSTLIEDGNYSKICEGKLPPYPLSQILVEGMPGYNLNNYINAKPGEKYHYSSFGTGVMGAIVECITKKRFAEYADEVIFKPLDLDAGYDPDHLKDASRIAKPYEVTMVDKQDHHAIAGDPNALKRSLETKKKLVHLPIGEAYRVPQGNLHVRSQDLAVILMIFLNRGRSKGVQILSSDMIAEMTKVQYRDKHICTGLNLHIWDTMIEGKRIIGHPGRSYGALTSFYFSVEDDTAVVVLTNGTNPYKDEFLCTRTCTEATRLIFNSIESL
ncbi:MAG: serine hydrolase domain-containing protein [Eubacteriales bacterium]